MCPVEYLVMCGYGMQRQLEKRQAEESRDVVQVSGTQSPNIDASVHDRMRKIRTME